MAERCGAPLWVQASHLQNSPSLCTAAEVFSWELDTSWLHLQLQGVGGLCLSSSSMAEAGLGARPRLRAIFFPRALHNISCQTYPKVSESPVGHRLPRNALPACQHRGWRAITPPWLGTECATALMSSRTQITCARAASQAEQLHHGTKWPLLRAGMELPLTPGKLMGAQPRAHLTG